MSAPSFTKEHVPAQSNLIPLQSTELPSVEYPLGALTGILGEMAEAVAEHVQCPAAIAGQSVIAAASLAVQSIADVLIDGRKFPCSLYALTIAVSGERKTYADKLVLRQHHNWEQEAWDQYRKDYASYEEGLSEYLDAKRKRKNDKDGVAHIIKAQTEPQKPESPQLLVSDMTFQGLTKAFGGGRPSQGIFSDEGGTFLGGWGMKSENVSYTISSLSRLWDGSPIQRTRGGDDIAAPLYNRRLACHLLITPTVAERNLSDFMLGQGFLPRFLIARPASKIGFRAYRATDSSSDPRCINFWARMGRLLSLPITRSEGGGCEARSLVLTAEAHELYVQVYNRFEDAMRPDHDLAEVTAFSKRWRALWRRCARISQDWKDRPLHATVGVQVATQGDKSPKPHKGSGGLTRHTTLPI